MKCKVDGCDSPVRYVGLCGKHYKRKWRHGDPKKTLIIMHEGERCNVQNCDKPAEIGFLCRMHNQREVRYGRVHNIVAAKGMGRPKTAGGYILLTVNSERIYEHVWLAEKALGKKLLPKAIVHHMNNIPDDNFTPLNLVVCPDQAYHMLLHKRARDLGYE
jgi:hypothetical protein